MGLLRALGTSPYLNATILGVVVAAALFLLSPRLEQNPLWRATITPLASIIGSGFLVIGPILSSSYGAYAPAVMVGLCLVAYLFGMAIRYSIAQRAERDDGPSPTVRVLETTASWSLGIAYVISVAYYLNLFGAFGVSLTNVNDPVHAKLLTTAVYLIIAIVGWTRGFSMLEQLEYFSVTAKLAIIGGLIVGLIAHFSNAAISGQLVLNAPALSGWSALTLGFGLIVTVQGFETSRYLGKEYDSNTRIKSMQLAQWSSTAIYVIYILLVTYSFNNADVKLTETAIVDMMHVVAPILPALLVAAALAAQFSAAVADTGGGGGLIAELTAERITTRQAYAILVGIGLLLTWSANVFEIISYASRAFAVYYGLQAAIAAVEAKTNEHRWLSLAYAGLAILGFLIAAFGQAVEN